MEAAMKNDIITLIKIIKQIIRLNKHATVPLELENALIELPKLISADKCNLYYAYTDLLAQFEEFIDNFNIDITQINKSIRDKFKKHHKNSSTTSDSEEDRDSTSEDNDESDDKKEIINKEEITMNNQVHDSLYSNIMNNLNAALEKVLISNNEELINNTVKLMNTLACNQSNSVNKINTKQTFNPNSGPNDTHAKTPKWLKDLNCSVNPKIKKDDPECLKYAITLSKTTGANCNRLKNIASNFKHFNFNKINYPPKEEDYKTFERNNESIKLPVLKLGDTKRQLHFHYNGEDKNSRNKKVVVILLENNHYIYVTKLKSLTKYITFN